MLFRSLLCLAHPLQVSTNPTVCLIKNMLWAEKIKITEIASSQTDPKSGDPIITFPHNLKPLPYANTPEEFVKTIIRNTIAVKYKDPDVSKPIVLKFINDYLRPGGDESRLQDNIKEVTKAFNILYKTYKIEAPTLTRSWGLDYAYPERTQKTIAEQYPSTNTFYDLLEDTVGANLSTEDIDKALGGTDNRKNIADGDPVADEQEKLADEQEKLKEGIEDAKDALIFLKNIPQPFFIEDDYRSELGIIGNIFVNLNLLYNEAVSHDLTAQDKTEKNNLSLYDFMKSILQKIAESTGNQNNFDVFVEIGRAHV